LSGLFALGGSEAASLRAAAVALDCFEVFAIFVSFRSAKPYPQEAALASGKPLWIAQILGVAKFRFSNRRSRLLSCQVMDAFIG
jgi:hypothetical protein